MINRKFTILMLISFLISGFYIPDVNAGTELITNGSFESDLVGWTNVGSASAMVSTDYAFTGSKSLMMGGYTNIIVEQVITPTPNYLLYNEIRFWTKVPSYPTISDPFDTSPWSETFGFTIVYNDASSDTWDLTITTDDWQFHLFTPDIEKEPAKIVFTTAEIYSVYLDNVTIEGLEPTYSICDIAGNPKHVFEYEEDVYVIGDDWPKLPGPGVRTYAAYTVTHGTLVADMPIPEPLVNYMLGYNIIIPNSFGQFGPTCIVPGINLISMIHQYLPPGIYDIIVDVDHDNVYDPELDQVDTFTVIPKFVIPEFPIGSLTGILTMILGLVVYTKLLR